MKITFLDAATLGEDISTDLFSTLGEVTVFAGTTAEELDAHIGDANILILNKAKITEDALEGHPHLRLICITATGYDNVDLAACRRRGVAVCNVVGYSTQSVAQLTILMGLSLLTHLNEYQSYVRDGSYTASGIANRLTPVYSEIYGKTWGIVGYGNIGGQVARVAEAMGCRVIVHKKTPTKDAVCVDFETLCRESDIISFHTPLNEGTRHMLDEAHIAMLKPTAVVINVARGAVTDEAALADAVKQGRIAGLGVDVYSAEPLPKDHPYQAIKQLPNVCLTPHMAWGAYETRMRLLEEVFQNIRSFLQGGDRNRLV